MKLGYMEKLEEDVLMRMVPSHEMVPVRPGRLSKTRFGRIVGSEIDTDELIVIDYYGHYKKSRGFALFIFREQELLVHRQLKMIKGPVIHFASIRIEDVSEYAPGLVAEFPQFKKWLLRLRGFIPTSATNTGSASTRRDM